MGVVKSPIKNMSTRSTARDAKAWTEGAHRNVLQYVEGERRGKAEPEGSPAQEAGFARPRGWRQIARGHGLIV